MKRIKNQGLRPFFLLQAGQFVSLFGSRMTSYSLTLWAYGRSGSVLSLSLLTVCFLVPSIFFSFLAGGFLDRVDKKKAMLVSDSLSALLTVLLLVLFQAGTLRVGVLYGVQFLLGALNAVQDPAADVAVSFLVEKEDYVRVSGIRSFCISFTGIFAPMVAGGLYGLLGLRAILLLDLGTFSFAFLTLLFLVHIPGGTRGGEREPFGRACLEGLRYLRGQRAILHLILFMGYVNLVYGFYQCFLPPMVLSRAGGGEMALAYVNGAIGAAGLCGSLLVSAIGLPRRKVPMMLGLLTVSYGVCNTLMGLGRHWGVWVLAGFCGQVLVPFLTSGVDFFMRSRVPGHMQGRVFSARNTMQYALLPVGYLLGGVLADEVLEPFLAGSSRTAQGLSHLVGAGPGSGIALGFLLLTAAGILGMAAFSRDRALRALDDDGEAVDS